MIKLTLTLVERISAMPRRIRLAVSGLDSKESAAFDNPVPDAERFALPVLPQSFSILPRTATRVLKVLKAASPQLSIARSELLIQRPTVSIAARAERVELEPGRLQKHLVDMSSALSKVVARACASPYGDLCSTSVLEFSRLLPWAVSARPCKETAPWAQRCHLKEFSFAATQRPPRTVLVTGFGGTRSAPLKNGMRLTIDRAWARPSRGISSARQNCSPSVSENACETRTLQATDVLDRAWHGMSSQERPGSR